MVFKKLMWISAIKVKVGKTFIIPGCAPITAVREAPRNNECLPYYSSWDEYLSRTKRYSILFQEGNHCKGAVSQARARYRISFARALRWSSSDKTNVNRAVIV